ncbi:MAG TPA: YsnF/AvaK domain-containing protein [Herpetosiphonaceae bacterium]|nr:YsnF/AvaK domain-containing protein [Herpetosiphonaceae bacterium]
MNTADTLVVVRSDGMLGSLTPLPPAADGELRMCASFEDGATVVVPNSSLIRQSDGTFRLPVEAGQLHVAAADGQIVLPVIEERVQVAKRRVAAGGVRVKKLVREHEEVVEEPVLRESVEVERIAKNELIPDGTAVETRHEGDTIIVPVIEEVIVLQKRLMLKEEIRITKTSQRTVTAQPVTLRREEIIVEPLDEQARGKG